MSDIKTRKSTDQDSGWPHEVDEILNTPTQNLVTLNAMEVIPELRAINICDLIAQVRS